MGNLALARFHLARLATEQVIASYGQSFLSRMGGFGTPCANKEDTANLGVLSQEPEAESRA